MIQILQHRKDGGIQIEELSAPKLRPGTVVVRNAFSLISAGTERSVVEADQVSLFERMRSRPELARQVLDNVRREGLRATYRKVNDKLDNYKELGYSSAGVVVESASDIAVGERVACAGAGYACHAEIVCVPRNLVARVPDDVGLDEAAFTTVCAIAMQGVRQADVRVGEQVAVIGLGLIGLIAVQLLRAAGCRVIGVDISPGNFELARALGCEACVISQHDAIRQVHGFTRGYGADAVLITAATDSNQPVELAIECARKRGKVVVVGAVSMAIPRSPFYEKEVEFRISCSYGPGRYDADYEERGCDYPVGFVRWTENRNMEAVLDLMAQRKLDTAALITHRIPAENGTQAYEIITGKLPGPYLGVLIQYPTGNAADAGPRRLELRGPRMTDSIPRRAVLGFIGAGAFTQAMILPPLLKLAPRMRGLATARPVNAKTTANKFGFEFCATDAAEIISDREVNLVFVTSRHDSHARYVTEALRAGKSVFVEKPPALTHEELEAIVEAHAEAEQGGKAPLLMVGYNRRFSAPVRAVQQYFADRAEPLAMHYRVNAGFAAATHWVQQPDQGGRIIGECGHFVDVLQFLCGAPPTSVYAVGPVDRARRYHDDNVLITITFADGSAGTIHYLANGASGVEKEFLEVFGDSKTARLWNFKQLECLTGEKKSTTSCSGDKGHAAEMKALLDSFQAGTGSPISLESLVATSRATFGAMESLRTGIVVRL